MASSGNKRLALTLYRSLLRWSESSRGVPFQLRYTDVQRCAPSVFHGVTPVQGSFEDAQAVRDITRLAFRQDKELQACIETLIKVYCMRIDGLLSISYWEEEKVEEALDRGLEAVQLLHTEYSRLLAQLRSAREVRSDRTKVAFSVGTVFTHKKFGYRGVVYGWDKECERDPDWAAAVQADPNQPFYHVLPDEDDCQRIFGAVRISKYVAQDNMEPITCSRRINHRAIAHYFDTYSPAVSRYIPNRKLQFEYPDPEYDAVDATSKQDCLQDSNVLDRPEHESDEEKSQPQPFGMAEAKYD